MTRATGTFDVKVTPQNQDDQGDGIVLGRLSIEKQFHGELTGTSHGEMLSAITAEKGSAGYVAVERVNATLNGLTGGFVLQHAATMTRGAPQLTIVVVPDSGTGQLVGITGRMDIRITEGTHFYDFEYALPSAG